MLPSICLSRPAALLQVRHFRCCWHDFVFPRVSCVGRPTAAPWPGLQPTKGTVLFNATISVDASSIVLSTGTDYRHLWHRALALKLPTPMVVTGKASTSVRALRILSWGQAARRRSRKKCSEGQVSKGSARVVSSVHPVR